MKPHENTPTIQTIPTHPFDDIHFDLETDNSTDPFIYEHNRTKHNDLIQEGVPEYWDGVFYINKKRSNSDLGVIITAKTRNNESWGYIDPINREFREYYSTDEHMTKAANIGNSCDVLNKMSERFVGLMSPRELMAAIGSTLHTNLEYKNNSSSDGINGCFNPSNLHKNIISIKYSEISGEDADGETSGEISGETSGETSEEEIFNMEALNVEERRIAPSIKQLNRIKYPSFKIKNSSNVFNYVLQNRVNLMDLEQIEGKDENNCCCKDIFVYLMHKMCFCFK